MVLGQLLPGAWRRMQAVPPARGHKRRWPPEGGQIWTVHQQRGVAATKPAVA
jgi:hypothetical protein